MLSRPAMLALIGASTLALAGSFAAAQEQAQPSADKWQPVAKTDSQEAFVNVASITLVAGQPEAKVKQNFAQPQPSTKKDKTFLSSRTTFRFDCAGRRVAMKEIRTYPSAELQGDTITKATSSDKYLQWVDAAPRTVYGEVLDYVCKAAPAG